MPQLFFVRFQPGVTVGLRAISRVVSPVRLQTPGSPASLAAWRPANRSSKLLKTAYDCALDFNNASFSQDMPVLVAVWLTL
jgi:hypothetical protein